MTEIQKFLKSKFKKDYTWGVNIYKRCGGDPTIILDLNKGFSKANWDFLRYQLKKCHNEGIVPKLSKNASVVKEKLPKSEPTDVVNKKIISTKTDLDEKKKPLTTSSNSKKRKESFSRNTSIFISNFLTRMKGLNWQKFTTVSLKYLIRRSTPDGRS